MLNANLYKMELTRYKNSMLIWSLVVSAMIILDMALFKVFVKDGTLDNIRPFLSSPMVGPMMKGFGLDLDKLTNILGFYVIRNTPLILLLTSMFSILMSTSVFAGEESEKTAEFLYTRPLTRHEIFISKTLACFTHILIINLIVDLVGIISMEIFKTQDYSRSAFIIHSCYGLFITVLFSTLGLAMASLAKRGRGLFARSIGIVIGTYFLDIISKTTEKAAFIGYVSPFRYVDTNILVPHYMLNITNVLFYSVCSIVFTAVAFRLFIRKDILY